MADLVGHLQAVLGAEYAIEREVGRGGMAIVFRARDRKHERVVAVKVLRSELAGVIGQERFLREILYAAEFNHPCILPLLDSGTAPAGDGFPSLPYYTMPFVEGESLRERLRRERQLPVDAAIDIARDVAAALDHAHAKGVIHRDIKPENIYLTGGHAIVADFGIARAVQQAADPDVLTSAGLVVGTALYMSPEQAAADPALDGRSDEYALGCVTYEMLGGEPPFVGATAQAILSRHRLDPPPALATLRPGLPPGVEQAVMRALAKSPADRFRGAGEFGEALGADREPAASRGRPSPRPRDWVLPGLVAAGVAAAAVAGWFLRDDRAGELNPDRVLIFPLVEGGKDIRAGTGQETALVIGSALEHTDPLRWIDGWTWLTPDARADVALLTRPEARTIARQRDARYYVDGVILGGDDSARVILRLNDAAGDSVVTQATVAAARGTVTFPQLGLQAINFLLPSLLEPGRRIERSPIAHHRPSAIAYWLQGEREYRQSHYRRALSYLRESIGADSTLARAALRGALAAEWEHDYDDAAAMVDLAIRHDSLLPARYVPFALGLRDYYAGRADSAERHLGEALLLDPDWSDALMALGEVRYHLFTSPDSGAADAFRRARRADPEFAPPLFHLAEIAIRNGDTDQATSLVAAFRRTDPDSLWVEELSLGLDCLRRGPDPDAWARAAAAFPLEVAHAAKVLASQGAHLGCAEAGFRALLAADSAPPAAQWGAVLGLQGILTARGDIAALEPLLDSAVATGIFAANGLYIVQAAAGNGMDRKAAAVVTQLGGDFATMGPGRLWFHGIWFAHLGAREGLAAIAAASAHLADSVGTPLARSTARSLGARLALLDADTTRAIELLQEVAPVGDFTQIEWGMQEPFGQEQLLLAQLLLAEGRPREAIEAASRLDHPQPIIYLVFLRQSLALRLRAAEASGRTALASEYRARLAKLSG